MLPAFMIKKVLKSQMKNVPKEYRGMAEKLLAKDPKLLMEIVADAQEEMKKGNGQMDALKTVAEKHKDKLKGLLT